VLTLLLVIGVVDDLWVASLGVTSRRASPIVLATFWLHGRKNTARIV